MASWRAGEFLGESPDPNRSLGTGPADGSCQSKHNGFSLSTAQINSIVQEFSLAAVLARASQRLAGSPAGIFGKGEGPGVGV